MADLAEISNVTITMSMNDGSEWVISNIRQDVIDRMMEALDEMREDEGVGQSL
jgi:hypothetical protein